MQPFKSTRLAWSVAIASFALWASSVPVSWGSVLAGSARLLDQSTDTSETTTSIDIQQGSTTTDSSDGSQSAPCPQLPAAINQLIPSIPTIGVPSGAASSVASGGTSQGMFRICGADAQTAGAIEQLVAGHGFSATLSARGDGCADLMIQVNSNVVSGSSSSNLSVSLGSGRKVVIQIASDHGVTHASIADG